jgi:CubicO group peptidase (beta-lactamase class C family)
VIAPGANEDADTGTRYRIGAVSQLFTSALVLLVAESGSITLDSKLAEFFPGLPNALDITYRDLLANRSGLADYALAPDFETWSVQSHTKDELLGRIEQSAPNFPPRERFEYSNTNYLLLSYVLEKVHDRPYADLVRTRIADKLGLARTYLGQRMEARRHEALAYEWKSGSWVRATESDPGLHLGAAGMVSSPADLVRFIDALFAGKVVSPTSLDSLRGVQGDALGLPRSDVGGRKAHGLSGAIDGYHAFVWHFPDAGISVSYATNASVLPPDEIMNEILALIFERGRRPPTYSGGKDH